MNNTSSPFNLESSCNEALLHSISPLRALTCSKHSAVDVKLLIGGDKPTEGATTRT